MLLQRRNESEPEVSMGAVLALASAVSFGMADFTGGLAAKRSSSVVVTAGVQIAGMLVLVPALLLLPGAPSASALLIGALAGLAGAGGLIVYLRGMAIGPMGVISPLAAVVGAALPVAWGVMWIGEELAGHDVAGILLGLVAVVCVAYVPGSPLAANIRGPLLALAGGVAFGAFFVLLDASPTDSGLWPLLGARLGSSLLLLPLWRKVWAARGDTVMRRLVLASGSFDMLANILFLLAVRSGLLSLTTLLASLYPVVVVLLARHVLAERLTALQGAGVASALVATALITV